MCPVLGCWEAGRKPQQMDLKNKKKIKDTAFEVTGRTFAIPPGYSRTFLLH